MGQFKNAHTEMLKRLLLVPEQGHIPAMRQISLTKGALYVCDDPEVSIVTGPIGSTLVLTAYDPEIHVAGVLHSLLPRPDSRHPLSSALEPMFTSSGLPALLKALETRSAEPARLIIKAIGLGKLSAAPECMDLATEHRQELDNALAMADLELTAEAVGGSRSHQVTMEVSSGNVTVSSRGESWQL